ncbi:hypothetical protein BVX97_01450 [bacterium E08(2017)]|nr:hypothetical protein BVX97_01450 [bacterium E08(2017)]
MVVAILATANVVSAEIEIPELREWVSTTGARLKARFVLEQGNNIILEREDGRRVKIAKIHLSLRDLAWLKQKGELTVHSVARDTPEKDHLADEKNSVPQPVAAGTPGGVGSLAAFSSGEWEGCYAVYQQPAYDAVVEPDATMKIYIKEHGKRIDAAPFTIKMACKPDGHANTSKIRKIVSFSKPGVPAMNPNDVILSGMLEDGVEFELKYNFDDGEITAWGRAIDPKKYDYPTKFRFQFKVPQAYDIPDDTPLEQQRELLAGNYFIQQDLDGRKTTCNYIKREKLKRYCRSLMITGPLYANRSITVNAKDVVNAPLYLYVNPIGAPWEGYSLTMTKEDAQSKKSKQVMVVEVE